MIQCRCLNNFKECILIYNPENIFKSNTQQATKIEPVKETEALVKVKKENWFKKAIEKIKSWFKKNEL